MTQIRARLLMSAVVLPLLAVPVAGQAASTKALDACVQTFLSSDVAKDKKITVYKKADAVVRPIALMGDSYTIEVIAKSRDTGEHLARVVCKADRNGTILAVNAQPTTAAGAALLSSR